MNDVVSPRHCGSGRAEDPIAPALSRTLIQIFALTSGVTVASLYLLQPLLEAIRQTFHTTSTTATIVVSASQLGYAAGLLLIVPAGDILNRRGLVPALLGFTAAALVLSAVSWNVETLLMGSLLTGIGASTAQVVVPWSAALAHPAERGKVVGAVMSGLLLGILLARVVAGLLAEAAGWRTVLVATAVLTLLLAVVVRRQAPADSRDVSMSYGQILKSIAPLIATERVLQQRMWLGFLTMFGFSSLWTSATFLLSGARGEHFHFDQAEIGLFGLAGVAGAIAAPIIGRLADRGHLARATTLSWVTIVAGWVLLSWPGTPILVYICGLVVLDFGIQGSQLSNQTAIYSLTAEARSRITTAYMVMYFVGAVCGSVASGVLYGAGGWPYVCVVGLATALVGMVSWWVIAFADRRNA